MEDYDFNIILANMKVITLTLNPAFDVHAKCLRFLEKEETIADITSIESGGKGVNISKALKSNDILNTAIIVIGKENGNNFLDGIKDLNTIPIFVDGRIRENITVHDMNNNETRLSFTGFKLDDKIVKDIENIVNKVEEELIFTFTGSIPSGINLECIKEFLISLKNKGVKLVIDSKSLSINDLKEIKPWLIKPNHPEIENYYKKSLSLEEIKEKALELNESGIKNVIISLGEKGSIYVSNNKTYLCTVPEIDVSSTIGAGDSTIAGFIYGYINGYKDDELIRIASAFGSAKCLRTGTLPPLKDDIKYIYDKTIITKM